MTKGYQKKEDLPRRRLRANPWFRLFDNHGYEPPHPVRTVDGQCPVKYGMYLYYTIRFCIIRIASSRRLRLYDVMDATDRTAQWRPRSSRSRLGPSKTEEQWRTADEED
jgi:hypothetical protein